jgi:MoaA/NifB/PqqE/SkfB family radical SAM enzyme
MALTQKCSFSCTFCYAGLQQLDAAPVEWKVYEQFLEDCAEVGVKAISLVSDGESTENPHFVDFVVKAKSLGLDIASGTNGLKLRELERLIPALTYLRINFNAATPERNASIMGTSVQNHHKVLDNVREAVRIKRRTGAKCTIGLQQVLLPSYADEVIPLALLGRELGVDYLVVKHCSDDEDGRLGVNYPWYRTNIAEQLFHAAEALSTDDYSVQAKWSKFRTGKDRAYSKCFGTALHLQMSGTGIVAPCGSFFSEKYKDKHIADIKTTRFRDIVKSERYWEVINHLKSDYFDPRKDCAALCLQDRSNLALFNLIEKDIPLPAAASNAHHNFL